MKSIWIPVIFQLGAFLVAMAEVIIPSLGLLTILALALFGYSWYAIVQLQSPAAVWGFLMADIIIIPLLIKYTLSMLKASPFAHRKALEHGTGKTDAVEASPELVGKTGIVESQLKPVGKAYIGDQLREVSSDGEIIDKGTEVRIIEVTGNKILVEPADKNTQ